MGGGGHCRSRVSAADRLLVAPRLVPFVRPDIRSHILATVRPIIEELWRGRHQTMFYAEGKWDAHLDAFRELPDRSIVFHIDRGDPLLTHRKLHDKFALSGGVSNVTLAIGEPEQVREEVRALIEGVGKEGGFILDAERDYPERHAAQKTCGPWSRPRTNSASMMRPSAAYPLCVAPAAGADGGDSREGRTPARSLCTVGRTLSRAHGADSGLRRMAERVWGATDAGGALFVWQMLLSF
jgi:hypothetical protein